MTGWGRKPTVRPFLFSVGTVRTNGIDCTTKMIQPQLLKANPYKIALEDGSPVQGMTGANGLTELLQRTEMQLANLEVFRNDPTKQRARVQTAQGQTHQDLSICFFA